MAFNLFKKQKHEIEKEEAEKVIENVEEPLSRFTFAYDDSIEVCKHILNEVKNTTLAELKANDRFIFDRIYSEDKTIISYPVFQMPETLPSTKVVSPSKIICIGSMDTDAKTGEILLVTSQFTAKTLDKVFDNISKDGTDRVQYFDFDHVTIDVISGEIDFVTLSKSIEIGAMLPLLWNNN